MKDTRFVIEIKERRSPDGKFIANKSKTVDRKTAKKVLAILNKYKKPARPRLSLGDGMVGR